MAPSQWRRRGSNSHTSACKADVFPIKLRPRAEGPLELSWAFLEGAVRAVTASRSGGTRTHRRNAHSFTDCCPCQSEPRSVALAPRGRTLAPLLYPRTDRVFLSLINDADNCVLARAGAPAMAYVPADESQREKSSAQRDSNPCLLDGNEKFYH